MLCILAGVTARGYTTLLKEAVVVDNVACANPAELGRKLQALPTEACTEATHPRCIVGLACHYLVALAELVGNVAVLVVPKLLAICRVYTYGAVKVGLANRVVYYVLKTSG